MPAEQSSLQGSSSNKAGLHLPFLDGVRGYAALYVVMHHAWNEMGWQDANKQLPCWLQHLMSFFAPGTYGVAVFIVLSGYCLMLPAASATDNSLRGGPARYFKRRAFRILPPYFAAFALSLVFYAAFSPFRHATGIQTQLSSCAEPATLKAAILSHLLLVHNVGATWAFKFNSPLWSVATEWQIYFALPFLLLPLWRKTNSIILALVAIFCGLLPHFVFHGLYDSAQHWLLGQFGMGCAAAAISFSARSLDKRLKDLPWGLLTALTLALLLIINFLPQLEKYWQAQAILSGVPAACMLVWCQKRGTDSATAGPIIGFFQNRFALWLGKISYSLYLTHILVVMLVSSYAPRELSWTSRLVVYMVADTLLALGLATVFHQVVERHFLNTKPQRAAQV
jgi:peptidoglycan/LPS O-acetylase OafA/YrhL